MVTLFGTSEVSGVSGDDERESIVAAVVVVDIDDEDEFKTTDVTKKHDAETDPSHPIEGCLCDTFPSLVAVARVVFSSSP